MEHILGWAILQLQAAQGVHLGEEGAEEEDHHHQAAAEGVEEEEAAWQRRLVTLTMLSWCWRYGVVR